MVFPDRMSPAQPVKKTKPAAADTPMMRQYLKIKANHKDAILFFRLGDFYEMFFDDAIEASRLLDLTLTSRNKNSDQPVPLCGVPYHSAESYIARLVKFGKKVVICEQTEEAREAKGIVRREVTRVVTPGMVLEEASLPARGNNYLLCFGRFKNEFACAVCDVSTGFLEYFTVASLDAILDEVARLGVREVIYPEALQSAGVPDQLATMPGLYHHAVSDLYGDRDWAGDLLLEHYGVGSLAALGLAEDSVALPPLGLLFGYLKESQLLKKGLLQQPTQRRYHDRMVLDATTVTNLEVFKTMGEDNAHGTLLWHMDFCETAMGSRRLAEFIRAPLVDGDRIRERLDAVEALLGKSGPWSLIAGPGGKDSGQVAPCASALEGIRRALKGIADLERLANRFVVGSASARDAVALKEAFLRLPALKEILSRFECSLLKELAGAIHDFSELAARIDRTVLEEPAASLTDGGLIKSGVNTELDELREIEKNAKAVIARMENAEREKTGIGSLKIRYNNVFGYYIEVTNTHKSKVPPHYVRKQTLTNAERYITDELKKYEAKVLGAAERIKTLEYEIFCDLRGDIGDAASLIKETAAALSVVDVLQSFAVLANKFGYVRPLISEEPILSLKGARHPVLERLVAEEPFVPNDIVLAPDGPRFLVITGPNMAGKSTVMRLAALTVIMAQVGCFVPCDEATVGICDRIFTRVGAHDHLQKGLSTFMVEMVETARILREATSKSLILLDEIGRGTSTFDGLSIAWAVAEDIHDRIGARTLFATHYHELCDLADQKAGVQNVHMAVKEFGGEILFLRTLKPGGSNRSYGVTVAGMSGLPGHTIRRAREILNLLEQKDRGFQADLSRRAVGQMPLFDPQPSVVERRLGEIDVNQMTPLEALRFLAELKEMSYNRN